MTFHGESLFNLPQVIRWPTDMARVASTSVRRWRRTSSPIQMRIRAEKLRGVRRNVGAVRRVARSLDQTV